MFGYALRFTAFSFCVFPFSFFFFACIFPQQVATVHALYINSSRNFWPVFREQCTDTLFTDPQISFFINFFIKNGFQSTIHTFKNYFAAVFSVFSFSKISSIQTDPETKQNSLKLVNLLHRVCLDRTYFAENWKHCSKIILKCVNSIMRPIFSKKVTEKRGLWVPCKCGWKVK